MKLRQKLAVVLASAMVVTSVPVVTMAASSNRLTKETLVVKKGDSINVSTTESQIKIRFTDAQLKGGVFEKEVFYLELENAEWEYENLQKLPQSETATSTDFTTGTYRVEMTGSDPATVVWTKQTDKIIKLEVALPANYDPAAKDLNDWFGFPLMAKATGGDATVAIVKKGAWSTVTEGKYVFATTGEKVATYKAGDATTFYTKGNIADITFTETYKGSIGTNSNFVTVTLQDGDFEFAPAATTDNTEYVFVDGKIVAYDSTDSKHKNEDIYYRYTVDAAYKYGFSGTAKLDAYISKADTGFMVVDLKGTTSTPDSLGEVTIKGIPVRATTKTPEAGDLLVDIAGAVDAKEDVKVATIAEYGTYIQMKDEKVVSIQAGLSKEIEFEIGEVVDDSMVGGREIEISLDQDTKFVTGKVTVTGDCISTKASEAPYVDKDGKLIVTLADGITRNDVKDKFTVKATVHVPISKKDAEKIMVKAVDTRSMENEVETQAIAIVNPFNITTEAMTVKVGLQDQVGGKITLTETDKAMFAKAGEITINVGNDKGFDFSDAKVEVTGGDLQKGDVTVTKGTNGGVVVKVKRASKVASTIVISDLKVTVDRTVAEGKYDLTIGGSAVDEDSCEYIVKDFLVVGTPNTEDLAANGLRRGTAVFTINSNKYVANGVEYTMDAAAFLQDPGYTMVPLRYVAYAFGVDQKDILFSNSTATIFAGERTIQLTIGSDIAVVNGAQIKMATKVVLKDGRAYAPIGEVSKLLGIDKGWDGATQTATFTNK